MKLAVTLVLSIFFGSIIGQSHVDMRFLKSSGEGEQVCYDLQILYHGNEVTLGSQNYRIFYSAASLKLDTETSKMQLPPDQYTFNVVQHNSGIDASGVGKLSFESDLGFINATIILNDSRMTGERLQESASWTTILNLCFNEIGKDLSKELVLARKEMTSAYGRAFIELSFIDANGAISSLPIQNYWDLKE